MTESAIASGRESPATEAEWDSDIDTMAACHKRNMEGGKTPEEKTGWRSVPGENVAEFTGSSGSRGERVAIKTIGNIGSLVVWLSAIPGCVHTTIRNADNVEHAMNQVNWLRSYLARLIDAEIATKREGSRYTLHPRRWEWLILPAIPIAAVVVRWIMCG